MTRTSVAHEMTNADLSPVHLAGYQGDRSILTRALRHLAEGLGARGMATHTEENIISSGEPAASLFKSVDTGARQICYMASGYLAARVPALSALDLPFSVTDRQAALSALDGVAGDYLAAELQKLTGYKLLGFWDNGFRHISNAVRPLRTLQDCEGLCIRTLDSMVYRDALAAMGFQPRSTDVKELMRVVQSGEVDAQENPLTNLVHFGIWRHHPYVSLTGHFFGLALLVCNAAWFDGLAADSQNALLEAAADANALQRELAAHEDDVLAQQLIDQGVQVLAPGDLDLASMRQATQAIVEREIKRLPPALVGAYLNQL